MCSATTHRVDQFRALVGCRFRATGRLEVTEERIRSYATAIHNRHPVHWSATAAARFGYPGLVAPPTFVSTALVGAHREILSTLLPGCSAEAVLHTDQTLRIGRLLVAGDEIRTAVHFDSLREYADFAELVVTEVFTDRHGEIAQIGTSTLLTALGPGTPGPRRLGALERVHRPLLNRRDDIAPHSDLEPEALTAGAPLPSAVTVLGSADLAGYADAVGDPFDTPTCGPRDPVAAAPGLLRLGIAAGFLTSWLGDPRAITTLRAEFSHCRSNPRAGSDGIRFEGNLADVDLARRTARVEFNARSRGRRLFAGAEATVRLPDARVRAAM